MKVTVYAELAEDVRKKLNRLAKKAAGYGIPFSYTESDEIPAVVRVMGVDPARPSVLYEVSRHTVAGVEFEIECDGLIKANGWKVCAKIEHGEKGNIVTGFAGYHAGQEWYTAKSNCDHCRVNRFRSMTFLVENEAGELRQVGSSCLKEYTGISPVTAAMWAEIQDLSEATMDCTEAVWVSRSPTWMYEVQNILAHACDVIREFGYRKSDEPNSTKEFVLDRITAHEVPSESGLREADEVMAWVREQDALLSAGNIDWNAVSDIVKNCIPLVLSGYAKMSHVGRLAYLPLAHQRYVERKARETAQQTADKHSEYVGEVGERITVKTETIHLLASWDNQWGVTYLYKLVDVDGNIFIWYASRPCSATGGETIKATVKDHGERNGVKQTIVTRCSIAA